MSILKYIKWFLVSVAVVVLTACGGGGSSDSNIGIINTGVTNTGVFLDSAVEGIKYKTSSGLEGYTNAEGKYQFKDGDTVEFLIGNVQLASAKAETLMTVFDLNNPDEVAIFLQSLDTDGNPNNGIQISTTTFIKLKNANFTIDEVDPESKSFNDKYASLMDNDFLVGKDEAQAHALNTLKKELINNIDPVLLQYISNNQYNDSPNLLDTGKNPKDYITSLRSKLRMYFTFEYINDFLDADIGTIDSLIDGKENTIDSVTKNLNDATDKWTKYLAIAGLASSGYKYVADLQKLKIYYGKGFLTDTEYLMQFERLKIALLSMTAAGSTIDHYYMQQDGDFNEIASECYSSAIPGNFFGQLQCFAKVSGEMAVSINSIYYNLKILELQRKRLALFVTKRYLDIYNAFDALNHPHVLAEAFTEMAKNKLSKEEAAKYTFNTFDQSNDNDLEKALDLIAIANFNLDTWTYNFDEAKDQITNYSTLVEKMTNDYIHSIDKDLLNSIDNQYLNIRISLEPDFNDKYKVCANMKNISNVNLKSIYGRLNFYLDNNLIGNKVFTSNGIGTINNFEQQCSQPFSTNTIDTALSMGLIKVSYNVKYLPNIYASDEKEQTGNKYFEINKHDLAFDTTRPIIKLITPPIVRTGQTIRLDASQTTSLNRNDTFSYTWEYLSEDKASINLQNPYSSVSSFVAPEFSIDKTSIRLKFKVTAKSIYNNLNTSKEVYVNIVHIANAKPVALSQSVSLNQNSTKYITLRGRDDDYDTLNYTIVTNPSNGTLSGAAPYLTYTPKTDYVGNDSFRFKVNDGREDSRVSTVSLNINALIGDEPVDPTPTPVIPTPPGTVPVSPSLISPINDSITTHNTPTLSWHQVSGATYYHLALAATNGNEIYDFITITSTSKITTALSNGEYRWAVNACNDNGCSANTYGIFTVDALPNTGEITHNGVTYGTVTSPYTGRVWLDRNLGASRVCTAFNDGACYGDYYQWGRNADGHEKSNSSTSSTKALSINPGHSYFINNAYDWTSDDNDGIQRSSQWSATNGSSICPIGFRVPTIEELRSETIDQGVENYADVFDNFLKVPVAGYRNYYDSSIYHKGNVAYLYSVDHVGNDVYFLYFREENAYSVNNSKDADTNSGAGTNAKAVRCLRN